MNYTKGKWIVVGSEIKKGNRNIATIWAKKRDGEAEANAHLIAAAPDLLKACEEHIEWFVKLSRYQNQRLGHGLKEACQTWGEASIVEPFDCSKMMAAIAKAKEGK